MTQPARSAELCGQRHSLRAVRHDPSPAAFFSPVPESVLWATWPRPQNAADCAIYQRPDTIARMVES